MECCETAEGDIDMSVGGALIDLLGRGNEWSGRCGYWREIIQ